MWFSEQWKFIKDISHRSHRKLMVLTYVSPVMNIPAKNRLLAAALSRLAKKNLANLEEQVEMLDGKVMVKLKYEKNEYVLPSIREFLTNVEHVGDFLKISKDILSVESKIYNPEYSFESVTEHFVKAIINYEAGINMDNRFAMYTFFAQSQPNALIARIYNLQVFIESFVKDNDFSDFYRLRGKKPAAEIMVDLNKRAYVAFKHLCDFENCTVPDLPFKLSNQRIIISEEDFRMFLYAEWGVSSYKEPHEILTYSFGFYVFHEYYQNTLALQVSAPLSSEDSHYYLYELNQMASFVGMDPIFRSHPNPNKSLILVSTEGLLALNSRLLNIRYAGTYLTALSSPRKLG